MKKLEIHITVRDSKSSPKLNTVSLKAEVVSTNLNEHDLAAVLFALEFAANNHAELPMRVHISEA